MIIDTHSHLFAKEFNNDLSECIKRAKDNNISKIILVGFDEETNELAIKMAQDNPIFYNTAGLHPSCVDNNIEHKIDNLKTFLENNKVYAIGECGLDYYWINDNKNEQKKLFEEQILLAIKHDLPLIVHMRDASSDTYDILLKYKDQVKGVMHCYSGSYEMAQKFIELGFYISLGGPVTFKNAKESKRVAKLIPLNRLLVETDCPYLAPTPYRGTRNETSYIVNIVEEIAILREKTKEEIEEATSKNAEKLFKL